MIDERRLWGDIEALARITDPARPYTRRSFSPLHAKGRDWLATQMQAAGLSTSIDAGGNLVGRLEGSVPGLAPIVTGSHSDTVGGGGRFDGIAGVVAGLEVARALKARGEPLRHPFEVIDFLAEEPSEFGMSCVGSRALAGELPAAALETRGPSGETLAQAMARAGARPEKLSGPLRPQGGVAAFFELHIEQGPVLEKAGIPIGIVTEIVGIKRLDVTLEGRPDHAGTTPMDLRRDAVLAAAQLVSWVRDAANARAKRPHYFVATVGRLAVEPNNSNVVPARVTLSVDARSNDRAALDDFAAALRAYCAAGLSDGVPARVQEVSTSPPTACDPRLRAILREACGAQKLRCTELPSGAGHDAVYMAKLGPAAMIFIPCREGRSHFPDEWSEPAQLHQGAAVLFEAILRCDRILSNRPLTQEAS